MTVPPEKIYIDANPTEHSEPVFKTEPWIIGKSIEYLSPEAVEKLLGEFYVYIQEYVELEVADKNESVADFLVLNKEAK